MFSFALWTDLRLVANICVLNFARHSEMALCIIMPSFATITVIVTKLIMICCAIMMLSADRHTVDRIVRFIGSNLRKVNNVFKLWKSPLTTTRISSQFPPPILQVLWQTIHDLH